MMASLFILLCLMGLSLLSAQQLCHVPGECETGIFLGSDAQDTYEDCMTSCRDLTNCIWISHFEGTHQCKYYQDCPEIDTSECSDCYTGEKTCPDVICSQPGFCQGASVGDSKSSTEEECQQECLENGQCNWYTFYPDFQDCVLTSDCLEVISSGSVYGEKGCYSPDPGNGTDPTMYTKLMTGDGDNGHYAEISDLSSTSTTCADVTDYPIHSNYAAVGTFVNDRGLMCGGYDDYNITLSSHMSTERCFSWNSESNVWDEETPMNVIREYAAAVPVSDELWWITGGHDDFTGITHNSTEMYHASTKQFVPYFDLPVPMASHNIININDTHTAVLYGPSQEIYCFDRTTELWTALPSIPSSRVWRCQAGLVAYPDGTIGIMVTGGRDIRTSDFLDLATLEWQLKASLPHDISMGESVPYKTSFLVIGGESEELDQTLDTTYYYSPENDEWQLLNRLQRGKNRFAAFLVPDWYANCTTGKNA